MLKIASFGHVTIAADDGGYSSYCRAILMNEETGEKVEIDLGDDALAAMQKLATGSVEQPHESALPAEEPLPENESSGPAEGEESVDLFGIG